MSALELSRRRLLALVGGAALVWQGRPFGLRPPAVDAQVLPGDPLIVPTLEAFADTIIPGEKRSPNDRPIAGAASGPGAVQAGALDLMNFPGAGVAPLLPAVAAGLNARAVAFAAQNGILLDPTVPPFVALDFADRTALLVQLLDGTDPDQILWFAVGALVVPRVPHRRAPRHRGRDRRRSSRPRRDRLPGAERGRPLALPERVLSPAARAQASTRQAREPELMARHHRRPRHRHRLRRLDPRLLPRRGRRARDHARARTAARRRRRSRRACRLGAYTRILDLHPRHRLRRHRRQLRRRLERRLLRGVACARRPSCSSVMGHARERVWPAAITRPGLDRWYKPRRARLARRAAALERRAVCGRRLRGARARAPATPAIPFRSPST